MFVVETCTAIRGDPGVPRSRKLPGVSVDVGKPAVFRTDSVPDQAEVDNCPQSGGREHQDRCDSELHEAAEHALDVAPGG